MMVPTVHLNGTPGSRLLEQLTSVCECLRETLKAMAEATPNGRDYYSQAPANSISIAMAEHRDRVHKIEEVLIAYEQMAIAVSDQMDGGAK